MTLNVIERGTEPAVDVVVLSMGRTESTLETLRDVLDQQAVDVRLTVVDQGSAPEHLERLRAFAADHRRVEVVEVGRNIGVPGGRNLGARRGHAPILVGIDNDAVFDRPDALAQVIERFAVEPQLGALGFRALNHFTGQPDWSSWAYPSTLRSREAEPFTAARFVGVGHAVRRRAFEETGGYEEALFFCEEELDLSYKLIACGWTIAYEPAIAVRHKVAPEARVSWNDRRLYLQTRNAVYLHWRYHRKLGETLMIAGGWGLRGLANRGGWQASRGLLAALGMCLRSRGDALRLGPAGRRYVWEHDTRWRGSVLDRARREALAPLPGR